jgi:AcrR family transcriptional regulator
MPKVHEKQLQRRKQETLDIAARMLIERGYANLNMDELAEAAGISKPTLYQYFTSKDELIAQAMVRNFQNLELYLSQQTEKSPLDQLEHFLRFTLKARYEHRGGAAGAVAQEDAATMRSIVRFHPDVVQRLASIKDMLEQVVGQAQQLGQIDPALPAWLVVNTLFSLQRVISNPFTKDSAPRSDEELAEAVEHIIRIFKQGVICGPRAEKPLPLAELIGTQSA